MRARTGRDKTLDKSRSISGTLYSIIPFLFFKEAP